MPESASNSLRFRSSRTGRAGKSVKAGYMPPSDHHPDFTDRQYDYCWWRNDEARYPSISF
jgi:hypothetical protein